MSGSGPLAAIVVPTHDHAVTLDLAVRSALEQTVEEIEVIVVGDGVGDDTRSVMARLLEEDARVRFLDLPKGPHHGEIHRGRAIESTRARFVAYLCDDDLLLADHVESMAELLEDADFAHSQNGYLRADGGWHHYFADLASPACRRWMLTPGQNVVSLTGTAHTVASYRRLPHGWRTTPPGNWPDHFMWQQFLAQSWVRAVTASRVTALQFPSYLDGRDEWPAGRRRAELERWRAELARSEGRAAFEETVRRGLIAAAAEQFLRAEDLQQQLRLSEERRVAEAAVAAERMAEVEATRTWRLRARLRRLRSLRAFARATARQGSRPES